MNSGYNAVVVYDDLSTHATAYRQMALLLRRPPGREAYPGDIFYLHSRLLERSAQLVTGGSLTGLPIVRTMGNDISGYIPTNIISITDGQLFLLISLMNKGIRPAVDLSLSVSRVGSAAQYKVMSFVSKRVKSMYALYKVFYGVSKLGSDDPEVNLHVNRGTKLLEFFKQAAYHTYTLLDQVTVMYILTLNCADNISVEGLNLFFRLLRSSTLARSVHITSTEAVLLIGRIDELEALLIIFGLDIIKNSLDEFADRFCTYFKTNLSRKY